MLSKEPEQWHTKDGRVTLFANLVLNRFVLTNNMRAACFCMVTTASLIGMCSFSCDLMISRKNMERQSLLGVVSRHL